MAAVWAAGPEPIMMTLECIVLTLGFGGKVEKGVLRVVRGEVEGGERRGAGRVCCNDAGAVVCFGWNVEAAARVRPKDERRGARQKAEENRMLVWGLSWGVFLGGWRFIFGMVYSAFNGEVSDLESRWIDSRYFELILVVYWAGFVNGASKIYLELLFLFPMSHFLSYSTASDVAISIVIRYDRADPVHDS